MARRNFFESSNPLLSEKRMKKQSSMDHVLDAGMVNENVERMTTSGAINKTYLLTGLLLATALFSYTNANPVLMWVGAIGGLIAVLVAVFKLEWSPILAPVYAGLEGLFVGGISYMYASVFNGIIFQAVTLTIGLLFMMLFIYKAEIIKVTGKFRAGVVMATGAVVLVYVLSWVLSFFGINMPFLHEGGTIGILISLAIIGIGCLNLLLDFDNFEKGEEYGLPLHMEWFFAMGLIVTLVWIYVEVLRLIAVISSGD